MSSLERHVLPRFGARLVSDIGPRDVLDVLLPIWTETPDMARRVRQRLSTVMKWAVASGYRSDNPGGDAIAGALPRSKKTQEHHRAVPHAEVGEVIGKVRESTGHLCTRLAFEFLVLTAARSGEVRRAVWEEMDVTSRKWTVPAERMKAREVHRVALSGAALAVLEQARELGAVQGLVFPSKLGRAISDATMSKLLRDLGIPGVPHGFRSSFRDWCGDTRVPREVAEACLAHTVGNRVEAAYARSDLFELRRPVMEDWAEYVRPTSSGAAPTPPSGTGPRREPPRAARGTRGRGRPRSGARREVELPQLALFVPGGESGDFGTRPRAQSVVAPFIVANPAAGGRDIVVGDVHGCFRTLERALGEIAFDTACDRLFGVGDLVNRGPHSADALEWLEFRFEAVTLGNHEVPVRDWFRSKLLKARGRGEDWLRDIPPSDYQRWWDALSVLPISITIETDYGLVGVGKRSGTVR